MSEHLLKLHRHTSTALRFSSGSKCALVHIPVRRHYSFETQHMSNHELQSYCLKNGIHVNFSTSERTKLVSAVENHKFQNIMGPTRALLYQSLDACAQTKPMGLSYSLDAKAVKDQADALHIFVRNKKRQHVKKKPSASEIIQDLPMEVVMITADSANICFTLLDGVHIILREKDYAATCFTKMAIDAINFLRSAKPQKSYTLFTCDSTRSVLKLLLEIRRGKHSDVEFTFNIKLFHRIMNSYHGFLRLGAPVLNARTIASQFDVCSPRPPPDNHRTSTEIELHCQGKDYHSVLQLYQNNLNPFGTGQGAEIDCLLTRPWSIVLYQLNPKPRYVSGQNTECTSQIMIVEEGLSQNFTGMTKQQLIQSMVDWLKKVAKMSTRYLILYTEEFDAKGMSAAAARLKLKCEFLELKQAVPKELRVKMSAADEYADLWHPMNLWKHWIRVLFEHHKVKCFPLRIIRRSLVSGILFRKTVLERIGRLDDEDQAGSGEVLPPHIKTSDTTFALPKWHNFRIDPARAEREAKCASSFSDFLLLNHSVHNGTVTIATRHNSDSVRISHSIKNADLSQLNTCQCIVALDARRLIGLFWERKELHDFFVRGGRVWCLSFASYTLNGRDRLLIDKTIQTARRLLEHRALGSEKKLQLVEALFARQKKFALKHRQFIMLASMMPSALMVNELSHAKIYFNVNNIVLARQEIFEEIAELKDQLIHLVPVEARPYFAWDEPDHLRTLFVGGAIKMQEKNAPDHFVPTLEVPKDPKIALHLAHCAGNLTHDVLQKYGNAHAVSHGTDSARPGFFDEMRKAVEATSTSARQICVLIAAFQATGLDYMQDHISELVLYNPATGKIETRGFSPTTDYLILSANSAMHGEVFIRKHFQSLDIQCKTVYYADISALIAHGRSRSMGKQVVLSGGGQYKESTMKHHLLDDAVELWRDVLGVSFGNVKQLIGSLVGTQHDPFPTQKLVFDDQCILPGMISHQKKLANARMSDQQQRMPLAELMHHEGTMDARRLCHLIQLTRLFKSAFLSQLTLKDVVKDNFISPQLAYMDTRTGRFTAAAPNVLNIPKNPQLRKSFASRFGDQGYILEIDYSMLEICTMAVLCGDRNMIADMNANVDFHTRNLVVLHPGYTYDELIHKIKVENNEELTKLRERAKIFSFQRLYGASQRMIVQSTGLSEKQVRTLIHEERQRYPGISRFHTDFLAVVHKLRADIQTPQKLTQGVALYTGEGVIPTGATFRFAQAHVRGIPVFSSTMLKNYPVQGLAAEIAHVMASKLAIFLKQRGYFGEKAYLVNVIHDSFVFDVHESVLPTCLPLFHDILQGVSDTFHEMYPEMHWKSTKFRVKASYGRTWGDMRPIQPPSGEKAVDQDMPKSDMPVLEELDMSPDKITIE